MLEYLPKSKYDPDCIHGLGQLDQTKLNILLPYLLISIQDINWPNAGMIVPFLISGGQEIIPEIEWVLTERMIFGKEIVYRYILMDLSLLKLSNLYFRY